MKKKLRKRWEVHAFTASGKNLLICTVRHFSAKGAEGYVKSHWQSDSRIKHAHEDFGETLSLETVFETIEHVVPVKKYEPVFTKAQVPQRFPEPQFKLFPELA